MREAEVPVTCSGYVGGGTHQFIQREIQIIQRITQTVVRKLNLKSEFDGHINRERHIPILCFLFVYSFFCLDFVVPLENFALIWRRTDIHLNITMLNHIHDNFMLHKMAAPGC